MNRRHDARRQRRSHKSSALAHHAEFFSQERLGRGRSKTNYYARADCRNFCLEPRRAGLNFRVARLFVDSPLASLIGSPVEMLYCIRGVNVGFVDSSDSERFIQKFPGGADKWMAGEVFFVAGLLADQHHQRRRGTFAKNCLCCPLPKITTSTICGRTSKI